MTNHPDNTSSEELRKQIADVKLKHWLANAGVNLGQYKAEYECSCGAKLVEDGHSEDPYKANITTVHAFHVADVIATALYERILAEAPEEKPFSSIANELPDNTIDAYNMGFTEANQEWLALLARVFNKGERER